MSIERDGKIVKYFNPNYGYHSNKSLNWYRSITEVCIMYYVKLVKGQSFYAFDHRFLLDQEEQVTQRIFKYLCKNEFFEVRKDEDTSTA